MTHAHTRHLAAHRQRGFTLIEVLIATFVIALGSIGLIALFAGAASQQRVASQTTMSVIVSKNAEAIIAPRFGTIEGTLFDGISGGNNPEDLDRGVWWPVPADIRGNLSINPGANNIQQRERAYFRLERNEPVVLFDLPEGQTWRQLALGRGRYRVDGQGPDGEIFNTSSASVRNFPVSRLDARATASIQVVTNDKVQLNDPAYNYQGEVTHRFVYVNVDYSEPRPPQWPPTAMYSNQGEYALFTQTGALPFSINQPYIVVKRQEEVAGAGFEPLARIEEFNLNGLVNGGGDPQAQRHLQRVIVPRVVYRSSEVISIRDRVVVAADPDFAEGVRPDVGYSLLYRKLESGSSQIAIFTYFISGTDRDGQFILTERENEAPQPFGSDSGSEEWGLQMVGGVTLAYDEEREQFYFIANGDEQIRALAPGSVLLVSGQREGAANRIEGADLPVRVVRQIRAPGGNAFRSYINRVPRAGGKSMLPFRNQTRDLDLWTIREEVTSRDGSVWSLRPRELRIFNTN